jgi:hypothetical protein
MGRFAQAEEVRLLLATGTVGLVHGDAQALDLLCIASVVKRMY